MFSAPLINLHLLKLSTSRHKSHISFHDIASYGNINNGSERAINYKKERKSDARKIFMWMIHEFMSVYLRIYLFITNENRKKAKKINID